MSTKQKTAIWLAVVLVVAASLYPPWLPVTYVLKQAERNKLYGIITHMKEQGESHKTIQSAVDDFKEAYGKPQIYHWLFEQSPRDSRVDLPRLFVEWVIAGAIASGLYLAWPKITISIKRGQVKSAGWTVGSALDLAVTLAFSFALPGVLIWAVFASGKMTAVSIAVFGIALLVVGFKIRNLVAAFKKRTEDRNGV